MTRWLHRLLTGLLVFQGLSGLVGGIGLVIDPSGASLGFPLEWLEGSPFSSYLVPGLVLLLLLGLLPLLLSVALRRPLGWTYSASIGIGLILLIWLGVEIVIVGYQSEPPLQLVYGLVGMGIVVSASVLESRVQGDARNPRRGSD